MANLLEQAAPSTTQHVMDALVRAIRVHYEQLPRRWLTPHKVSRMFRIDVDVAEDLLELLVAEGYLYRTEGDLFRREAVH